jgi:hypothetical protein
MFSITERWLTEGDAPEISGADPPGWAPREERNRQVSKIVEMLAGDRYTPSCPGSE